MLPCLNKDILAALPICCACPAEGSGRSGFIPRQLGRANLEMAMCAAARCPHPRRAARDTPPAQRWAPQPKLQPGAAPQPWWQG